MLLSRSARLPVTPADAARPIGSLRADLVRGFAECADKRVTIVRVTYVPGGYTPSHRHAVSVIPYVTAETIRSQFAGGPVETFKVVESFFEYVHPTLAAVAHRHTNADGTPIAPTVIVTIMQPPEPKPQLTLAGPKSDDTVQ